MRKLFLLLMILPISCFGQTAEEFYNKGRSYYKLQNYHAAIDVYTKAISLDLNIAKVYSNRGIAYGMLGKYELAIDDFTKSIRIDPNYLFAYTNRGRAYYYLESYENAITDYNIAIEIDPNNANTYRDRGVAKEEFGLNYCSDYESACALGYRDCCVWYNDQCR